MDRSWGWLAQDADLRKKVRSGIRRSGDVRRVLDSPRSLEWRRCGGFGSAVRCGVRRGDRFCRLFANDDVSQTRKLPSAIGVRRHGGRGAFPALGAAGKYSPQRRGGAEENKAKVKPKSAEAAKDAEASAVAQRGPVWRRLPIRASSRRGEIGPFAVPGKGAPASPTGQHVSIALLRETTKKQFLAEARSPQRIVQRLPDALDRRLGDGAQDGVAGSGGVFSSLK